MNNWQPWLYEYREYQKKSENAEKELAGWAKVSWGIFIGFLAALTITGLLHSRSGVLTAAATLLIVAYHLRKRALHKHLSGLWRHFWDNRSEAERNQVHEFEAAERSRQSRY